MDSLDGLRFELAAFKGRILNSKWLDTGGKRYLQLGSGESRLEGFLNSDFFFNKKAEARLDLRFPLPFPDNTWSGIYAHHVVEHLSYEDVFQLARECHRILKPAGIFRMVVPDLQVFLRIYLDPDERRRQQIFRLYPDHAMQTLSVRTPLEMIDYVFRDNKFNRHRSAWDWETAETRLREAGFSEVERSSVNVSRDSMLSAHDKPHWSSFSLYVEAVK